MVIVTLKIMIEALLRSSNEHIYTEVPLMTPFQIKALPELALNQTHVECLKSFKSKYIQLLFNRFFKATFFLRRKLI